MLLKINRYTTIKIETDEKYGIKLIEGWLDQDGEWRPVTCKRTFKKGEPEKKAPVSVKIGDTREGAAKVAKEILDFLTPAKPGNNEDVPF